MKDRPIIMIGESVRAILAGTKTQTRRVVRGPVDFVGGQGQRDDLTCWGYWVDDMYGRWAVLARGLDQHHAHGLVSMPCPFGVPGGRLWVRETWRQSPGSMSVHYRADSDEVAGGPWRSAIHMPRWASRLTLEVTDVRVQRLQEISEEDARAEGVPRLQRDAPDSPWSEGPAWFRMGFRDAWDALNGKRAPWSSNPFVWAPTFKVVREPVGCVPEGE